MCRQKLTFYIVTSFKNEIQNVNPLTCGTKIDRDAMKLAWRLLTFTQNQLPLAIIKFH